MRDFILHHRRLTIWLAALAIAALPAPALADCYRKAVELCDFGDGPLGGGYSCVGIAWVTCLITEP